MADEVRSYGKYEYCKAVGCKKLIRHPRYADQHACLTSSYTCIMSAKEFHNWLQENGFFIVKRLSGCTETEINDPEQYEPVGD